MNRLVKSTVIAIGVMIETQLRLPGLYVRSVRELVTTEIELSAMASPASSGRNTSPAKAKTRAAIGMPTTL